MAKRFIDSNIFRKGFLKPLPPNVKLFYIYLFCECDHYGIWNVEIDVAQVRLGVSLEYTYTRDLLADKIIEIDGGTKWFIPQFISFQYGTLTERHKLHRSVIRELTARNLYRYVTLTEPLPNPYGTDKDKDKDKEQDKEQDKDKENGANYVKQVIDTPYIGTETETHGNPATLRYREVYGEGSIETLTAQETPRKTHENAYTGVTPKKRGGKTGGKTGGTGMPPSPYQDFIGAYQTWTETRGGVFRFTASDGKAMKEIIAYLQTVETVKNGSKSPLELWEFILNNWSKLNAWMQTQVQVRQINSQLPNIIEQLKQTYNGGKQTSKTNAVADFAQSLRNVIKGNETT